MVDTTTDVQVRQLRTAVLVPSQTNRKHFNEASLMELAASIKESGIHQPLIVRPIDMTAYEGHIDPPDTQLYELVTGHRRLMAAIEIALLTVPCIVKEITDNAAREIQVIENLQREDPHPMDESEAYGELLKVHGSIQLVAARVGKPVEYVTGRLKLQSLGTWSRDAFWGGLITVDHALLLAKLGPEEQDEALRWTLNKNCTKRQHTDELIKDAKESLAKKANPNDFYRHYWEPQSPKELKAHIESQVGLKLSKAPWDLADEHLLESAGSCTNCQSQTAANEALFACLVIKDATCMDSACFAAKKQAFVQLQMEAVEDAGKAVIKLSHKHSTSKPRFEKDDPAKVKLEQVFRQGQWVEVKKGSCENVITGVMVDFDEHGSGKPGVKKQVCVAAKCKAHKKDWEKSSGGGSNRSTYNEAEENEKREEKKRVAMEHTQIRVGNTISSLQSVKKLTPVVLREIIAKGFSYPGSGSVSILGKDIKTRIQQADVNGAEFAKLAIVMLLDREFEANYYTSDLDGETTRFYAYLEKLTGYKAPPLSKAKQKATEPKAKPADKPKSAAKKAAKKGGRRG